MTPARARPRARRLAPASLAAVAACCAALAGEDGGAGGEDGPATERPEYGPGRELSRLENREVTESSGVACSRANRGVFWTHNDSGDRARVFAFDARGRDLGTFRVTGASSVDWEDMASFTLGGRGYLALADVGDNAAVRGQCTIYIAEEPRLAPPRGGPPGPPETRREGNARVALRIRFTYEDGPHNCESLAVDPTTRTIYLVSKVEGAECRVYALPIPRGKTPKPSVAKAVATLSVPTTTAADISPDGLRAVVLTYCDAFEYARGPRETWADAFARKPRTIRMPRRQQGESVCYGPDGKTLYLTSEVGKSDKGCPLLEVAPAK